jgi:hypothetical protein
LTLTVTVVGALPELGLTDSQFPVEDAVAVKLSELAEVKTDKEMAAGGELCCCH